jgi:GrxC family glutaredoxin
MPAAIEIYTRPGCGYCSAAKSLLTRKNAAFTEFDIAKDPALRQQMWDRAGAGSTFPQIFIGDTHVGGCDELYALDREGKLDAMLAGEEAKLPSTGLSFTAAMVQMRTGLLPEPSLAQATKLIREAAARGADYVQTPEVSNMMQVNRKALFEHLASEEDDLSLKAYRTLAQELKIHLHVGSLALRATPERAVNRAFLIGPDGGVIASYDKIHMFDIDLPGGESYRESANYQPGETAVIADLPWGRIGLTICYDLRFPALYRALAESGASYLTVPSAFTKKTGEAHWHTLLRARAIENGCFVFAAAQAGLHENKRETYGHSLIVDPWGRVLAEGGVEPGIIMAKIDPAKVESARNSVPSLQHGRRFSIADPKASPEHLHLVRGSA